MKLKQLAKRVRQLGYHLEYQKYIEAKINENTIAVKSYLLSEGKSSIVIGGYKVALEEDELKLEALPEVEYETISLFEGLKEAI